MPEVTIIFTCLNSIKYLKEAIDSSMCQTFADFEFLAIDAGSTDGTVEFLENYNDSRIRVIHSDIKSHGVQCNIGLDNARGRYIGFFESDDILPVDAYEIFYKLITEYDVDYVKGSYLRFITFNDDTCVLDYQASSPSDYQNKVLTQKEIGRLRGIDNSMWCGLYKKEFLDTNRIRLNTTSGASFQDYGFYSLQLYYAEKAYYSDKIIYKYRLDNPNNSQHNKNRIKFALAEFKYLILRIPNKESDAYYYLFERAYRMFWNYLSDWFLWNSDSTEARGVCDEFYDLYIQEYRRIDEAKRNMFKFNKSKEFKLYLNNFDEWLNLRKRGLLINKNYTKQITQLVAKYPLIAICYDDDLPVSITRFTYAYFKKRNILCVFKLINIGVKDKNGLELPITTIEETICEDALYVVPSALSAKKLYNANIPAERVCCFGRTLTEVWDFI